MISRSVPSCPSGEAWEQIREGVCDAMDFGVIGTENWGAGEIRGNLMRDVAALMKIEMLPWDEWGSMTESYNGETGSEFDRLMDEAAEACASRNRSSIDQIHFQLAIPDELIK